MDICTGVKSPEYRGSNPLGTTNEFDVTANRQSPTLMHEGSNPSTRAELKKCKTMEQEQQQWRKLSGERIKIPIADEVSNVLMREKEMGHEMKVCIGTDSQVKGKETEFATVIVFIRKGKGGFMYIHNEITRQKMSIKQRMLMEVGKEY